MIIFVDKKSKRARILDDDGTGYILTEITVNSGVQSSQFYTTAPSSQFYTTAPYQYYFHIQGIKVSQEQDKKIGLYSGPITLLDFTDM